MHADTARNILGYVHADAAIDRRQIESARELVELTGRGRGGDGISPAGPRPHGPGRPSGQHLARELLAALALLAARRRRRPLPAG